jgi:hypothetical protein
VRNDARVPSWVESWQVFPALQRGPGEALANVASAAEKLASECSQREREIIAGRPLAVSRASSVGFRKSGPRQCSLAPSSVARGG